MTEVRRVDGPSSPLGGQGSRVAVIVALAILVAVVKPWTFGSPAGVTASPSPRPTASPSERPVPSVSSVVDLSMFGPEPPAEWELWPAGYLVSFGFALRIDSRAPDPPSASPSPGPGASSATAGPEVPATEPIWPARIVIPSDSHLVLFGINTPIGPKIDSIQLSRADGHGGWTAVAVTRLVSPWPEHFTVFGVDDGVEPTSADPWAPGTYRLGMVIEPGHAVRSVEVVIPTTEGSPSAAPSSGTAP